MFPAPGGQLDANHQQPRGTAVATRPPMPMDEVVVITGASAGIGRALARRFARDGAKVALLARGAVGLEAAAAEVEQLGSRVLAIRVDVADADAVEAAAAQIEQELGPIDIWINNATAMLFGRAEDTSPEEVRRVSDVTYHGAVWGTMAALRRMRARGRGTIVQVGSGTAHRGIPLQSAHSAAKHALRSYTDALRVELLHDGIDVHLTMVQLSAVNTPLFSWARNHMPREIRPIPPIYQPELVADIIHWTAHARRREVVFGWSAIAAVYANKLAPRLLDRLLARYAFEVQQGSDPVAADHRDNLFVAIEADVGAHGQFDDRARSRAPVAEFLARWGGVLSRLRAIEKRLR